MVKQPGDARSRWPIDSRPPRRVAAVGASALVAVDYQRKSKNKIKDLVKQYSRKEYSAEKVETFME